jgi:hypothetical protein
VKVNGRPEQKAQIEGVQGPPKRRSSTHDRRKRADLSDCFSVGNAGPDTHVEADAVTYESLPGEPQTSYEYDWLVLGGSGLLNNPTPPPPVPVGLACDVLHNIISDVLYSCTGEITCAGRRHAEPYADAFGMRIHFSHDFDLAVALWNILLIDANRVDPYVATLMSVTQITEGVMKIKRDEKVLV